MEVSIMRQSDSLRVAELITHAIENIGRDEAGPHLAYMTRPDHTPDYAYKYYNVRSRHFRLQEVFFVAHDSDLDRIEGVVSFADISHGKGYIRVLALEPTLLNGSDGQDVVWFLRKAVGELARFVQLGAVRLVTAAQEQGEEPVGPHVSALLRQEIERCGFRRLARLEREGGQAVHVEIFESPVD